MSDGTGIEWCDATWQPLVGCTRVSEGCDNCYAIGTIHRFRKPDGLTKLRPKTASRPGVDWSGSVKLQPERLADPLRWRRPRRIFPCSQADMFHPSVPFEYIAAIFGIMAATPQHTYLVLTKRPERAREFFEWVQQQHRVYADETGAAICVRHLERSHFLTDGARDVWPLPNVHLGTSVETQRYADERIPALLKCPAALYWVSAEPQLGPIDLRRYLRPGTLCNCDPSAPAEARCSGTMSRCNTGLRRLGHVIPGGESGPRARDYDLQWARSLILQCHDAGVPVFMKQIGSRPYVGANGKAGRITHGDRGRWFDDVDGRTYEVGSYSGGEMHEWPPDIRVRQLPETRSA